METPAAAAPSRIFVVHRLQHACWFGRGNARLAVERQRGRRDGDAGGRCDFANVRTVTPATRPTPDGLSRVGRSAARHHRTVPKLFRSVNSSDTVFRARTGTKRARSAG